MPIFYNKVERGNPGNRTAPKKWYATLKRITMVKEKQVARLIADETTLNPKEAEMGLAQLEKILIRELLASNTVQLGDWGSFSLTCNSAGHNTREEVTASSILKLNVRFTPGKNLRDALKNAQFIPVESMTGKK